MVFKTFLADLLPFESQVQVYSHCVEVKLNFSVEDLVMNIFLQPVSH